MVDLAEIQAAYYMVAATGVLVAAAYYIINTRTTLQTRQAQLFMQIYQHYMSEHYKQQANKIYFDWDWKGLDDFQSKYGQKTNPEAYSVYSSVVTFYEGIGLLIKRGLIDKTLVDDLMSSSITRLWEKISPLVMEQRKAWRWPQIAEQFEYLYSEVKPIEIKQHPELKA